METEQSALKQLTKLGRMPLGALRDQWRALYGTDPPAAYGKAQLMRRLAWRTQELHYGGLSDRARYRLRKIADGDELASGRQRPTRRKRHILAPGTRLVRQWQGIEHVVTTMADGGFEWGGRRYRTLTAVAKAITGQHCSGPRFFGLVSPSKEGS